MNTLKNILLIGASVVLAATIWNSGASSAKEQGGRELARLQEQQRQQRARQLETDRARLVAQAKASEQEAITRAWRNPMAFAALVVAGYGVAKRLTEDLTEDQRNVLAGLVVLAAGYIIFNFEECNALLRDLTEIESRRQRAQAEIAAITAELSGLAPAGVSNN